MDHDRAINDRAECYDRIRAIMRDGISVYYKLHTDRFGDERSEEAIARSVEGLRSILSVLEDFDLTKRTGVKNGTA